MRERHFPRLCRTCEAPMARQEDTCWRCGAVWYDAHVPGGAPQDTRAPAPADAMAELEAEPVGALAGVR